MRATFVSLPIIICLGIFSITANAQAADATDAAADSGRVLSESFSTTVLKTTTDKNFFAPEVAAVPVQAQASSTLFALFTQLAQIKELLGSSSTTAKFSQKAIKTKTYTDKALGVTLRYPSSLPVTVVPAADKRLSGMAEMIKIYEFKSKGSDVPAFTFAAVSGDMGELYWSFFEIGLSQGLREGLGTRSSSSKSSQVSQAVNSAFAFQKKTVPYQGYELKHEYLAFNGKPVVGMYTAKRTVPEGTFLGVVSLYTTLPMSAKDKKFVLNEQAAKDNVVTILKKSVLDPKKIEKNFQ